MNSAARHLSGNLTPKQRKILDVREQNPTLSMRQVAKLADVTHAYVIDVYQRYGITEPRYIEDYKQNRADILAGVQSRLLSAITPEDIAKAPMGSKVLAVAQLYDKERLERGQSSANFHHIHEDIQAIRETPVHDVPTSELIDV
jgi:hypothetical protein